MNSRYSFFVLLLVLLACNTTQDTPMVKSIMIDKDVQFVESLMADMTLEDKVGEMTQLTIDMISVGEPYALQEPHTLDEKKLQNILVDLKVGSILNCGGHAYTREHWAKIIETIQDYATNKKESGIPVLYGIDAIHGTNYTSGATLFPQQLGQAATWNPDLAKACGEVTAYETRASGIPLTFSPVLDIGRDARWPRLWETYGEDMHLATELGVAYIDGLQGDDISNPHKIASCMKHFLGYSVTLRGRDRTQAWIPERQLREYFLPTFRAAVEAGAKTIMINSGEMNGIPVHADSKILVDLLRDELGFKGLAVTDWEDIGYLVSRHKVATDFKDAIRISINAGIDMAMVPTDASFPTLLAELVREGQVPMSRVDESVKRILMVKKALGLFDAPLVDFASYTDFASKKHEAKALMTAEESIVLVKNQENILPLAAEKNILVVGPNADRMNAMNGGWTGTWQGDNPQYDTPGKLTVLAALKAKSQGTVTYAEADQAVNAAASADVIVACLGEGSYTEKPGDLDDLNLDEDQMELIKALKETGKRIVLIMLEGRPRVIRKIVDDASAILVGFLPGDEGGKAIANILYGDVNPSGKLPVTYPRYSNDLVTYDHKGTDKIDRQFGTNAFNPQWEFGYGLSYTQFSYSNLAVSPTSNGMHVSVTVTNSGDKKGKEVIQVYVQDMVASITPAAKRLRAFDKIELEPGASRSLSFMITKEDLSFVGADNTRVFEPGEFRVECGGLYENLSL